MFYLINTILFFYCIFVVSLQNTTNEKHIKKIPDMDCWHERTAQASLWLPDDNPKSGYFIIMLKQCNGCKRMLEGTPWFFYRSGRTDDGLTNRCKECYGAEFGKHKINKVGHIEVKDGHKICAKCRRELPSTVYYFTKSTNIKSGVGSYCKECLGYTFGIHHNVNIKQPTDGSFICTKCLTHYPTIKGHFHRDSSKKSGYRTICKNCYKERANLTMDSRREYKREYEKNRKKTDVHYKIRAVLTGRIRDAVKNGKKCANTMKLVGCSLDYYKFWIESQFKDGMNWDEFMKGNIHIDHIKECQEFDLSDPDQQRICFHYTNTQPMWKIDNIKKGQKTRNKLKKLC